MFENMQARMILADPVFHFLGEAGAEIVNNMAQHFDLEKYQVFV